MEDESFIPCVRLDYAKYYVTSVSKPHTSFYIGRRYGSSEEAEDAGGFDEHYFRRRPKSFCIPAAAAGGGGGVPGTVPGMPPRAMFYGEQASAAGLHLSMGSLLEEQQQQRAAGGGPMVRNKGIYLQGGPKVTLPILCALLGGLVCVFSRVS